MNIDPNGNRPKLKKIKRPINRTAPIGNNTPQPMGNISHSAEQSPNNATSQSFGGNIYQSQPQTSTPNYREINNYLDDSKNLPETKSQYTENEPKFLSEEDFYDDQPYSDVPEWLNTKVYAITIAACLLIGILAGKLFFSQSTVVRNGLQGVVVNSEVPRGRARCGIAERSQGCVLYLMNPQRQEMVAKDFYDLASQVTGRQRFMIETGNMRYANSKIKPGDIVQLNIPPL